MKHFQPFWFDQAMQLEPPSSPSKMPAHCDIAIIGGGFTGLWTAIQVKLADPSRQIVVLEKDLCGQGASGRNGGAMLTWSSKIISLIKLYGLQQARFLVNASEQAVHAIKEFTEQYQIDCDCRIDGTYYTYSNAAQLGTLDPVMEKLQQLGCQAWRPLTAEDRLRTGSATNLAGWYSPHAGSVQPALLVRGLKRVAESLGVCVVEQSRYLSHKGHQQLEIATCRGPLKASQLVFAVNAWLPSLLPAFAKKVVLVSSDMLITDPIPATLEALHLQHGAPIIDGRIFVNYYRTTSCGRLMLGKGGNYFSFANQISHRFDQQSHYEPLLKQSLAHFFPQQQLPLARSWTGPSDRSVTGMPFFGRLPNQPQVFYGSGYSGNGVVQSYLGGKILASLLLGQQDVWSHCGLVDQQLPNFPPEPFRTAGAYVIRNAIRRKEQAEDQQRQPRGLDQWLSRLSGAAAKADLSG